jgi:signal transduction histidine kinase
MNSDYEILILAPTGQDGTAAVEVLGTHNIGSYAFADMSELCQRLKSPSGAILIAEEALTLENSDQLKRALSIQEAWSSIPIILMTSEFEKILSAEKIMEILGTSGSLSILERPFKILTLISAIRVALGAREKQYEVRELLRQQVLALRQRDEFLSIASHELKTPLTSLKIQVQIRKRLLEKKDESVFSPEKVTGLVDIADKQIDRLIRLVDDMLDITRIQNGKLSLNIKTVEFDLLASEVVQNFSDEYHRAGCELSFHSEEHLLIEGDRYRLEQVIANLLSNALKYGEKCPVSVRASKEGNKVILSVKDQGMGISEENQKRIFDRFERAVSPNNIGGLGLGLYITRQIVELHKGTIKVESVEGKGSEFLLELPANI